MWHSYIFRKCCKFWHHTPLSCQKRCSKIQKIWHKNEAPYGQQISSHMLHKVEIWSGVTDALLTTLKDRTTQVVLKFKSGALVTQNMSFFPGPPNWCRLLPQDCLFKGKCALFGCTAIFLQKSPQRLDFRMEDLAEEMVELVLSHLPLQVMFIFLKKQNCVFVFRFWK